MYSFPGSLCSPEKISKFIKTPTDQRKIRIDTINSINSINFNGVLNITYNDTNNKKENNNSKTAHHLITELSNSYISRRTNTIKANDNDETNNIIKKNGLFLLWKWNK